MDFFKSQLARLQEQIGQLSATQKMLTAALLAIMVMTMVFWGRFAGKPEFEAVIDQDLSVEDMARMKTAIAAKGVSYQVNGNRLLVPADRKFELFVDLSYAQLLPANSESGWDQIIAKMDSPWNSPSRNDAMWNKIKEATLGQVISAFPRVGKAIVMLDQKQRRTLSENDTSPSASVIITLKSGQHMDKKLVGAAADAVAGACAGMQRGRVKVIIDGASFTVEDAGADGSSGGDWLDKVKETERYYAGKINEHLAHIENAMISVSVDPVTEKITTVSTLYDGAHKLQYDQHIKTETEENTTTSANGNGETGTGPNLRSEVTPSRGGEGTNHTNEKSETDTAMLVPTTNQWKSSPPGAIPVVAVSVQVPRSYIVRVAKSRMAGPTREPTQAEIDNTELGAFSDIRRAVKGCTNLKDESMVAVAEYVDLAPPPVIAAATASSPVTAMLGGHLKDIVLGAMALLSLFMVSMMVKKGGNGGATMAANAAAAALAAEAETEKVTKVLSVDELAGEVVEGNSMLDGIEMDEESVRNKQVVDQVTTMVKENPDGAAALVKRWLNRA